MDAPEQIPPATIAAIAVLAAILVIIIAIPLVLRSKRRNGYKALAHKLGFEYSLCDWTDDYAVPALAGTDQWIRVERHLVSGSVENTLVALCDAEILPNVINDELFPSTIRSDVDYYDGHAAHSTTAVILRAPGVSMPSFTLSPRDRSEDWMTGDEGVRGFADEAFMGRNRVMSADQDGIVTAMSGQAQKLLRRNKTLTIYGKGDVLVMCRYMERMPFDEIETVLEMGQRLAKTLTSK